MSTKLASERTFRRVADVILSASKGDDTFVSFRDSQSSTLRFANDQVVQHVSVRAPSLSVRVAFGKRVGSASTNRMDVASLKETLRKAETIAHLTPQDPEYLSPLGKQRYVKIPSFDNSTASATPMDLAKRTKPVIDACMRDGLVAAGIMTGSVTAKGLAASSGLFGYEQSTDSRFSLTATGEDSSGWTYNAHRDIDRLDVARRTRNAVQKALMSKAPREVPAGHYPVILEPSAVAGIFGPFFWQLSAKNYHKGNSAFVDKLGSVVLDTRLSVESDPTHSDLLGSKFGGDGLPTSKQSWVVNGVLKQLYYDRFTAKEHGEQQTPWPGSPIMTFDGPTVSSIDELVANTERAILITNFWYIRSVNPRDITVTGMTRDGTFMVENGKIAYGLKNFRFHDSPIRCLRQVDAATKPLQAITLERGKMLLPALKLPDFYLSSVTKF